MSLHYEFCISSCLLWNNIWVLRQRGAVVIYLRQQAAGVHTETLNVVRSMQSHLLSCGSWNRAAEPCNSVGNEGHWKPSIRPSDLRLRSQARIIPLLLSDIVLLPWIFVCVLSPPGIVVFQTLFYDTLRISSEAAESLCYDAVWLASNLKR